MRTEARTLTIGCFAALLCASALHGQEPAAAPFHRGQWGVDFGVSNGFYGIGLVRFRGPTRAWVLDVTGDFVSSRDTTQFSLHEAAIQQVALQFGTRSYHPVGSHVFRTLAFGLSGSYAHRHDTTTGGSTLNMTNLGAGLFGELGAQWMVTPHLSLGAVWSANLRYSHGRATSAGSSTLSTDTVELLFGGIGLRGAFYF